MCKGRGKGTESVKGLTELMWGLTESVWGREETCVEIGWQWMPWAVNGCTLHIGEIVLIVDSDTVICLHNVACKLVESLEITIIQHESWGGLGQYLDEF